VGILSYFETYFEGFREIFRQKEQFGGRLRLRKYHNEEAGTMNQIIALLLAGLLCLTACGDNTGIPTVNEPPEETAPVTVSQPVTEKEPEPEPNYALEITQPVYTVTENLEVHIVNNTGEDRCVLLIPHLERLDESGAWVEVPYQDKVGFCGTPDPLPAGEKNWSEDIVCLWGTLEEGQYRIHYNVGREFDTDDAVYGEFTVCAPLCGYPLAE